MEQILIDEKKLRKIPPMFVLILVLILSLPMIAYNLFDIDFAKLTKGFDFSKALNTYLIESQIREYFRQTLLQWSAFSLASITVVLAFIQYRLVNDKIALIIGLSVLFSGSIEILHTLIIDGVAPIYIDKPNFDAVIWTLSNTISGIILFFGLLYVLKSKQDKMISVSVISLISILFVLVAYSSIYSISLWIKLPDMWDAEATLSRPYETIYLFIYLIILFFVYPGIYKKYPYILTNCIFYMAITEIVMATYMMLLSTHPQDNAFIIAYFLKIVVYFIPFSCLIINYVFSYNEVSKEQVKLKINRDKLNYLASHDSLTNLFNRHEFENQLDKKIVESAKKQESFAVLLFDIDNFKAVNDTYGHLYGDEYIKTFADHFRKITRKGDILSRMGSDEFTLISAKLKAKKYAKTLADRLLTGINTTPLIVGDHTIANTSSIGVVIYPDDGKTSQELLRKADIAMYNAKNAGKSVYRFYSDSNA